MGVGVTTPPHQSFLRPRGVLTILGYGYDIVRRAATYRYRFDLSMPIKLPETCTGHKENKADHDERFA